MQQADAPSSEAFDCKIQELEGLVSKILAKKNAFGEEMLPFYLKPSVGTWLLQLPYPLPGLQEALAETTAMTNQDVKLDFHEEPTSSLKGFCFQPSVGTWLVPRYCSAVPHGVGKAIAEPEAAIGKAAFKAVVEEGGTIDLIEEVAAKAPPSMGFESDSKFEKAATSAAPQPAATIATTENTATNVSPKAALAAWSDGAAVEKAAASTSTPVSSAAISSEVQPPRAARGAAAPAAPVAAAVADMAGGVSPAPKATEQPGGTGAVPPALRIATALVQPAAPSMAVAKSQAKGPAGEAKSPHRSLPDLETGHGLTKPAPSEVIEPPTGGLQLPPKLAARTAGPASAPEPAAPPATVADVLGPGAMLFRVSVPSPYPGVQYRNSKDLTDRDKKYAENGATFMGVYEDNGEWVRLADGKYLPTRVGTIEAISAVDVRPTNQSRREEEKQACWWMWCSVCTAQTGANNEIVFPPEGQLAADKPPRAEGPQARR